MENISSLNSPHIERVKALLGPRGKKTREAESSFVVEGIQSVREALSPKIKEGLILKKLYLTEDGYSKLSLEIAGEVLSRYELVRVSDQVMKAMADSESPQGILAICSTKSLKLKDLWQISPRKIAYFWQIQDPGNAGTVIRTADACGFDAVVFSEESVDIFNPKTVRASVGSLWHIPVVADINFTDFISDSKDHGFNIYALDAKGNSILDATFKTQTSAGPSAWIFGNEARGLPELPADINRVSIPMKGFAESLNVASAAAIVMHSVGLPL
jgi:TrmH family RNA methyltransferase